MEILLLPTLLCCYACASFFTFRPQNPSFDLPAYQSQKRIKTQGFKIVPTPSGAQPSVYFGYDRNHDATDMRKPQNYNGIDLLEFKALQPGGGWQRQAFLIFSDDDFDGIADRILLDSNGNGRLDVSRNIKEKEIRMERIDFNRINL